MLFGYLWILIMFTVFNFIQGIYILIVYAILRSVRVKSLIIDDEDRNNEDNTSGTVYQTSVAQASTGLSSLADLNRSSGDVASLDEEIQWHTRSESADLNDLIIALQSEDKQSYYDEEDDNDEEEDDDDNITCVETPVSMRSSKIKDSPRVIEAEVHGVDTKIDEIDSNLENQVLPDTRL